MMKRTHRLRGRDLAGIRILLVLGLVVAVMPIQVSAGIVGFSDPGLEAAIREAIDKPTGDILDTDLIGVTSLDARYHNIVSLEGIERLVNLKELDLYGNEIVDIAPLSGLTNLTTLILTRNRITDIGPLSPLTNLSTLQLRYNQIHDIRPLVNNPSFAGGADISLSFNPLPLHPGSPGMRDIEALQGRGVNVFFAPAVYFPDPGFEAAIREAIGKPTEDIQDADLIGLTSLDARYRNIVSLEGIEHCINLTELDLYGNKIVDISSLSALIKLTNLSLEDNEIADLSPLSGLTNLTRLYLDNNQIANLSPLSGLINLTGLYLWENAISDLSPLSGLINLTGLYLYFNYIVDVSPLSSLTHLRGLGLSWNQIVDITALSGLTHLTRLYLDNNRIVDIAPLVNNVGIDRDDILHLQENPLFLQAEAPNMLDIEILQARGVKVDYTPEK